MPLTVVIEDGTGKADANAYVTVAECDTYHEAHLYGSAWTGATADNKAKAVVMATRTIDAAVVFNGYQNGAQQALAWPRFECPREGMQPDGVRQPLTGDSSQYWPSNALPQLLKNATCELARQLLVGDRTADAETKGVKKLGIGKGAIEVEFNPEDRASVLPDEVVRMLDPLCRVRGGGMMRKVVRK